MAQDEDLEVATQQHAVHPKIQFIHRSPQNILQYLSVNRLIMKLAIASLLVGSAASFTPSSFINGGVSHKVASSSALDMKYKVAVVGGGPSGACAAEIFAQEKNIDTVFFERKMNNAKPCGGAIPLCMIGEFDIPESTVDRKVGSVSHNDVNLFGKIRAVFVIMGCIFWMIGAADLEEGQEFVGIVVYSLSRGVGDG